jgi:hypothetical protein
LNLAEKQTLSDCVEFAGSDDCDGKSAERRIRDGAFPPALAGCGKGTYACSSYKFAADSMEKGKSP